MSTKCYFDKKLLEQKQEALNNAETIEQFLQRGGSVVKISKNKSGLKPTNKKQTNKINGLKLLQAAKGTIHEKQVLKLLRSKGIKI